jgi:hypothetical protein
MKANNTGALLLIGGAGAVGVLALAAAFTSGKKQPKGHRMDWVARVIARVSRHEGGYESLNRNSDGAGLSFGILQWAQKPGSLGALLAAMQKADPTAFARIFGSSWQKLLATTKSGSLASVAGEVLWKHPWTTRFKEAGQYEVFRAVQRRMAQQGIHFRGAIDAARILGIATERSMALFFDTAVQQGPGAATKVARQALAYRQRAGQAGASYVDVLTAYAQLGADRCRSATAPSKPPSSSHLRWVQVGNEWHLFANKIDLHQNIWKRRIAIVRDRDLSDNPVSLEG